MNPVADFSPELKRLLLAAGCRFERAGKGDHEIWSSPITNVRFPVDSKIKSRHTAKRGLEAGWYAEKFPMVLAAVL